MNVDGFVFEFCDAIFIDNNLVILIQFIVCGVDKTRYPFIISMKIMNEYLIN